MAELTNVLVNNKILEGLILIEKQLKYQDHSSRDTAHLLVEFINNLVIQAKIANIPVADEYITRLESIRNCIGIHPCSSQELFDEYILNSLDIYEGWINSGTIHTKLSQHPIDFIGDEDCRRMIDKGLPRINENIKLAKYLDFIVNPEYTTRIDNIKELLSHDSE